LASIYYYQFLVIKVASVGTAGLARNIIAPNLVVLTRKLNITAKLKIALNQWRLEIHLLAKPAL
jgi:hypothetical protein